MITTIHPPKISASSGSALLMILIGVVLFASLSYAVMQSVRVGEGQMSQVSKSKMDLQVAELTDFLQSVQAQTNNMMVSDHIAETNIDFRTDTYQLSTGVANCANQNANCTTASCRVFSPDNPNGVKPVVISDIADKPAQAGVTKSKNGHGQIGQIIVSGLGTSAPDMVFIIRGVSPTFCNYYNAKQGITTSFTSASVLTDIGETEASSIPNTLGGCASSTVFNSTNAIGDEATAFANKPTFCVPADVTAVSSRLAIIYVLKKR